ncbi:MAG: substrate-binding domain-containing protein [Oscillospiraceae bacterium]|nr:substrate-binding domain-containing protein [Oscillospiraceae bacterium]
MVDRSSYEPLYRQIKRDIEEQILNGSIKIGDKLMSETEMLNHYHCGRTTIRNALAELVLSGCLRKEQGFGTFCAAMPKRDVPKNIDVFLNTADTYFIPYILSGISRVLDERNCNLILHDTLDSMENIAQGLTQVLDRGTDGVIIQPYTGPEEISTDCRRALSRCAEMGIPLITIDGKFKGMDTACIMNNDDWGGLMATEHLIEMGHCNILSLFRNRYKDSAYRSAGYREAMKKAALTPHIIDADITAPEDWVQYIKTEQITAVVCYNDLLAVECYHALSSAGLRVYEDVSVVGYDNTELSSTALPKITSITHPKDIMGEQAASFLLDWLEGRAEPGYHFMFQPELIRRDSVRNLKK